MNNAIVYRASVGGWAMNSAIVAYRNTADELSWLIVRPALVETAKRALRVRGMPAIAIIRWKRRELEPYE
jgi:hypothetical protein